MTFFSSIVEKAAALAEKYSTQYGIKRDDSTDELLKSVHAQREARKKQLLSSEAAKNVSTGGPCITFFLGPRK